MPQPSAITSNRSGNVTMYMQMTMSSSTLREAWVWWSFGGGCRLAAAAVRGGGVILCRALAAPPCGARAGRSLLAAVEDEKPEERRACVGGGAHRMRQTSSGLFRPAQHLPVISGGKQPAFTGLLSIPNF
jgi:hypothetical protein